MSNPLFEASGSLLSAEVPTATRLSALDEDAGPVRVVLRVLLGTALERGDLER